jgi:hypothetical protein
MNKSPEHQIPLHALGLKGGHLSLCREELVHEPVAGKFGAVIVGALKLKGAC